MRQFLLPALFLLGSLPLAEATQQERAAQLTSADEWQRLCTVFERDELVNICASKVHRAVANGRSLGTFEAIPAASGQLLQTRSGVFFRQSLNELVVHVPEDNGLKTRVRLKDDVTCQTYAAAPDLVGRPQAGNNYQRLIDAWLREYTDTPFAAPQIRVATLDYRHVLQFDTETHGQRTISGTYVYDDKANAGIFTTCDHPSQSANARRNAAQFMKSLVGSARRFG
jgi:hypothetical protein